MPSLRQKVTTYFRQLSFIAEPRDGPRSPRKTEDDDGNFITKYLEGRMDRIFVPGPEIYNGQNPTDLPELHISTYLTGPNTITAACTGPDDGLTGIKRSKLHLSASYADDIDFIDTIQDNDCLEVRKSIANNTRTHTKFNRFTHARKLNSSSLGAATTPTSDQNANKTFSANSQSAAGTGGMRSRKNSKTGIANLQKQQQHAATEASNNRDAAAATTKLNVTKKEDNSNKATTIVVSMVSSTKSATSSPLTTIKLTTTSVNANTTATDAANDQNNKNLINAKTDATTTTTITAQELNEDNATPPPPPTTTIATTTLVVNGTKDISNNTTKMLEDATARLLREAVSNQAAEVGCNGGGSSLLVDPIAGVTNWKMETECAYGISVSLYENNMLTKEPMGNPIADCYGMVVRGDSAVLALADGVNWGDGARLAARSAVHGCLDYLDRAIFGLATECMATTTHEVFVSLLRSLWEGHGCILEVGGALSTLTIAVVLPLAKRTNECEELEKYVVCACNVGDSLGYVYSKKHGVREFTQASHDISSMRDMRDALGALGPADGNKPELSNLTLSMTTIERGDIIFLTSDGISDNFDPVVGKFAEAWTPDVKMNPTTAPHAGVLAPKRQNKSASSIYARLHHHNRNEPSTPPVRPPRTKKSSSPDDVSSCVSSSSSSSAASGAPSRPKYMRSQTVIEPRRISSAGNNPAGGRQATTHQHHQQNRYNAVTLSTKIPKSVAGLPLVTGPQRHALTLYRLEDLLSYGINGTFSPCVSARRLCHLLIDFVRMITSARRKTLEQRELFYKLSTGPDGIKREVELNRMQHRATRKRIVDSSAFASLPGKLDHATVVAYLVGGGGGNTRSCQVGVTYETMTPTINNALTGGKAPLQSQEFQETNF